MEFCYINMEFTTRFSYSEMVPIFFTLFLRYFCAISVISAISVITMISAVLSWVFLHLKWHWFHIRNAETNIKNAVIQRLHFRRVKTPQNRCKLRNKKEICGKSASSSLVPVWAVANYMAGRVPLQGRKIM